MNLLEFVMATFLLNIFLTISPKFNFQVPMIFAFSYNMVSSPPLSLVLNALFISLLFLSEKYNSSPLSEVKQNFVGECMAGKSLDQST